MSVRDILGADGKVSYEFLPAGPPVQNINAYTADLTYSELTIAPAPGIFNGVQYFQLQDGGGTTFGPLVVGGLYSVQGMYSFRESAPSVAGGLILDTMVIVAPQNNDLPLFGIVFDGTTPFVPNPGTGAGPVSLWPTTAFNLMFIATDTSLKIGIQWEKLGGTDCNVIAYLTNVVLTRLS